MGIVRGHEASSLLHAKAGLPLGGNAAFTTLGVIWRDGLQANLVPLPIGTLSIPGPKTLSRITAPRLPWAGLSLDHPVVMGIINCTPDSFSDGGDHFDASTAIAAALSMIDAGADVIDVGGESTRPGAAQISVQDEIARIQPVVAALAARGIVVSIDTRHAAVMGAALESGAKIINDIAALQEPGALEMAARSDAAICLMHMQGEPGTMQSAPHYDCAPLDVYDFLSQRVAAAVAAGISLDRITVDPGIGFGKTTEHNLQIMTNLALLHGLGAGILLGVSRKRFIAELAGGASPKDRFPGSLATALAGLNAGAQILRVHDVAETVQAVRVWNAI